MNWSAGGLPKRPVVAMTSPDASGRTQTGHRGMPRVFVASVDAHPRWLSLAAAGSAIAVALRLFGLPPIAIHGPLHRFGVMDPSCGLTRATRYLALGNLHEAWRFNPGVFVVAAAAGIAIARATVGRHTGRWLEVEVSHPRLFQFAAIALVVVFWIHQQLHASLLR